uniref:Gag-Pol polyprotein n=1 Tax=Tanacetum cinerariifolium TaxID=118510 RepID=A0A6L2MXX7_TANCI|nr:Gag-Pol polyprotein [Tanacetum cinerariifolium]
MFEEYFEKRSSEVSINSVAQQVHNYEDLPLISSIIIEEYEAPPIVTTSDKQTSPISINEADELNQEDSADFNGNTVFVPYDALNFEEVEPSTTNLDPSTMHEFHKDECIQFEETFAHVAHLEAVRMFIVFAAHKNIAILQMDVRTAFLN